MTHPDTRILRRIRAQKDDLHSVVYILAQWIAKDEARQEDAERYLSEMVRHCDGKGHNPTCWQMALDAVAKDRAAQDAAA